MTLHNDEKLHTDLPYSTVNNSRRNFIKLCGAAGVGGVSGLLFPKDTVAIDSLNLIESKASEGIFDDIFWSFVRMQFPVEPGLIYMNTGTEGVMSRYVISRIERYFKEFAKNPWESVLEHECYCYGMPEISTTVAEFLGVDSTDEIVMTTNTTEGVCLVANGLNLNEGDEILTTLHFAPYNCSFLLLRDRKNVTVTEIEWSMCFCTRPCISTFLTQSTSFDVAP